MASERFRTFLELRGLDVKDAELFFRLLSTISNSKAVDFESFVQGFVKLRGFASSIDLQTLRYEMKIMSANHARSLERLSEALSAQQPAPPRAAVSAGMGSSSSSYHSRLVRAVQRDIEFIG